jgi:hypothetical protein
MNENTKAAVVSRKILHDGVVLGTVIEINVPLKAKQLRFPGQNEEIGGTYLHFNYPVKGGIVNFHIKTDQEFQGQTVRAYLQIVQKTMDDGREFLYVDLIPVDLPVTRKLHVLGTEHESRAGWFVYDLEGFNPTICLADSSDKRAPQSRSIVAYSESQTNVNPFVGLFATK